jgi:hypothetical protein
MLQVQMQRGFVAMFRSIRLACSVVVAHKQERLLVNVRTLFENGLKNWESAKLLGDGWKLLFIVLSLRHGKGQIFMQLEGI